MPNTALITGATGLLGRAVLKAFEASGWNAVGTGFSRADPPRILKCDIQDEADLAQLIEKVKPQAVIHCAADRQPDSCTNNPEGARRLNVQATSSLATLCAKNKIFLVYISTDYVFPGQPGQAPFNVTDKPAPTNIYGQTKADGEVAVLEACAAPGSAVCLRVPVLYGETVPRDNNKESAVNVLMDAVWKSQDPKNKVVMDDYAIRYPTNTADVARVCRDIASLYISKQGKDLPKILHFSSEDRMTKWEITKIFGEIMDLPVDKIEPDAESGKKPAADGTLRPYDCHLSTDELKKLEIDVSTVDFAVWWKRWVGAYRH